MAILQFTDVVKSYRRDFWSSKFFALNGVTFSVPEGEITGFLGANGAGKTTSIKILLEFIKPDSGMITFPLFNNQSLQTIKKRVGYLPERPYFYPHLTGREFLSYMGQLSDIQKSELRSAIISWSKRFQIDHALDRKLSNYSKGMLQRIGFASTLLHSPDFLILDEPMSGLDPVGREEFKEVICELHREGKTIFFSSHIVSDVEEICRSIVLLDRGTLAYQGHISDLISKNMEELVFIEFSSPESVCEELKKSIEVQKTGGGLFTTSLHLEKRDATVSQIVGGGGSIRKLASLRPTLEKIIYKIRG